MRMTLGLARSCPALYYSVLSFDFSGGGGAGGGGVRKGVAGKEWRRGGGPIGRRRKR